MKKCHSAYLACTAALLGTGLGATPAAAAHHTLVVRPGGSIQKAVNAARPGDTVLVLAGTFHESITVKTPGLTLRGVGRRTVIKPSTKKAAPHRRKGCLESGEGICVIGQRNSPVPNITISDLTVTGFSQDGLWSMATDHLTVQRVTAANNGRRGISQEHSTRGVFRDNTARDNRDAGLYLANTTKSKAGATDTHGTVIERNHLMGNRSGLTILRLRNLTITRNYLTGNCAGMFVVSDENKPKAGSLAISKNIVRQNNKYCAKIARLPFLQGSGIVLTGAENTLVTENLITGNSGKSPLSGGIVLFKSYVGAKNERNRISGNQLANNNPADLVNQEAAKSNNTFQGNSCQASKPTGLCSSNSHGSTRFGHNNRT
ncbi:right-handed parallel beta-helix repeat-containing protein [Streptomyces sp. RPT161]|uniref:right-handed parallel beta-helix repeat-containing protein n=1 Tax=Streptomyces sp. RPT161 TaxID=3015993 RepID=UPI0022B92548|nr:right-handed parallel beta-helix repeat-containing protein [Streptomyces sp. RPT161]